jgi:hypothetical protein
MMLNIKHLADPFPQIWVMFVFKRLAFGSSKTSSRAATAQAALCDPST